MKAKVSELHRRLEDATRAYQQEKRVSPSRKHVICSHVTSGHVTVALQEKEEKGQRISELESETKVSGQ